MTGNRETSQEPIPITYRRETIVATPDKGQVDRRVSQPQKSLGGRNTSTW